MINGTYAVQLKTPMGVKKGDIVFQDDESSLSGKLVIIGNENLFHDGETDGVNFHFNGEMVTAVGRVTYECNGQVIGKDIIGNVKTEKGVMFMSGKRK